MNYPGRSHVTTRVLKSKRGSQKKEPDKWQLEKGFGTAS